MSRINVSGQRNLLLACMSTVVLSWLIVVAFPTGFAFSETVKPSCRKNAPKSFLGSEILRYVVKVFKPPLVFSDAAEVNISVRRILKAHPPIIELVLKARTKGFASWASHGLYQEHRSSAVEMGKGSARRFVSKKYRFSQEGGDNPGQVLFLVDYSKRKLVRLQYASVSAGGEKVASSEWTIPPGVLYEDSLVAFFNLRQRNHFPEEGEEIIIKTFPFEGGERPYDEIRIRRATAEIEDQHRYMDLIGSKEALILVDVPSGVFRKGQRVRVRMLFKEATQTPRQVVVENVIPFFGDAIGSFVCFGTDVLDKVLSHKIN